MKIVQITSHNVYAVGGEENVKILLINHLQSLSAADRYLRFFCSISDETIINIVNKINFVKDGIFVVFNEAGSEIQGFLMAAVLEENFHTEYEFGLSVSDDLRGKGIGYEMFKRAAMWAKSLGCSRIYVNCLSKNKGMQKIAERFNMETHSLDYETKEGELKFLGVPNVLNYIMHHAQNNVYVCDLAYRRRVNSVLDALRTPEGEDDIERAR